jgi:hypothetical protein
MECLNHFAPAIQALAASVIVFLTLVLVYATWRYVQVSEALQKPCVVVKSEPRGNQAVLAAPYVTQASQQAGDVVIVNVGTGSALNLQFGFRQTNVPQGGVAMHLPGFVHYLQAGQQSQVPLARTSLANREFEFYATYNSLSGKQYETKIGLDDGVIKSFTFK